MIRALLYLLAVSQTAVVINLRAVVQPAPSARHALILSITRSHAARAPSRSGPYPRSV